MANTATFSFTLTPPKPKTTPLSSLPTKSILNLKSKPNPFSFSVSQSSALKSFSDHTTTTSPSYRNLKARLRSGQTLYGIFLLTFSPSLAEIAGLSGYDFVVVDMEHGHGTISDTLHCLHALAASQTAAIIRVPETTATWAKKALDLGPQGIMFPMVESAKSAAKAVSFCRFPPAGVRGSAHPIVRASSYGIDEGHLNNYLDEILIMCQVESEEGVKNIDKIVAVDGVDCIQMGPLDLSASMGYLWDPGNTKVRETLREAERKVLKRKSEKDDVFLSGFALPFDGPKDLRSRGYHMVSGATDVGLFRSSAVEDVVRFKESLVEDDEDSDREELDKDGDAKYWSE